MKYEASGSLADKPRRRRRRIAVQVVDDVATQVEEDRLYRFMNSTSFRRFSETVK